jgi:hypothetical protein
MIDFVTKIIELLISLNQLIINYQTLFRNNHIVYLINITKVRNKSIKSDANLKKQKDSPKLSSLLNGLGSYKKMLY